MTAAISVSFMPGPIRSPTCAKISSVSSTAARIRAISNGDFRPRSDATMGLDETRRSAYGVPSKVSRSTSQSPCVSPSAAGSLSE